MRIQNTETQGPRMGWLVLLIAVSLVLITIWFRESETGPLHRTRGFVHAMAAPVSMVGETLTSPVRDMAAWVGDLGVSRSQLERLRDQNSSLRARVASLEEAKSENERLRKLVELVQVTDLEAVGAHVIGRSSNSWEGYITIDLGTTDGIEVGMPVVGPEGLIGQITSISPRSSRVKLISDQRSGVAAMIQRSRAEGIARGSIDGALTLDFVSKETTVKAGDVVITSGMGGAFPKGILIGEVAEARRTTSGLYQEIELTPTESVARLEEVLVLVEKPDVSVGQGGE